MAPDTKGHPGAFYLTERPMRVNFPSLKRLFYGLEQVLTILTHDAFHGLVRPVYLCIHLFC